MTFQSLKLVCFSPTGTSKAIVQGIARGIGYDHVEIMDITRSKARKEPLQLSENDLLAIAVPVYMGRVPVLLQEWLHTVKAYNTPAVCVVVYGNRVYDDALLELKNILMQQGCLPIAGAAFIGEHSFSSTEIPTAQGRPDASDMDTAESFGRKIKEKLQAISSLDNNSKLYVPGNFPYGGATTLWSVDFIGVADTCTQCGICAQECPVDAIDAKNSHFIDQEKCITCCACIKRCPQAARTMKSSPVKEAALRLSTLYKERKDPVCFL